MKRIILIGVFTLGVSGVVSAKSFGVEKPLKTIQSSVEGEEALKPLVLDSEYQVEEEDGGVDFGERLLRLERI